MKLKTYIITFLAFAMAQALRITFPFNKSQVQSKYNVDDFFLGLMDVIYCLTYSIGACLHFIIVNRNSIKQTYLKFAILGSISGCFFAILSLFFDNKLVQDQHLDNIVKKSVLIINMSLFGFSQFVVWPLNLSLVSEYYKPETDGRMIGLWSSAWQLGNILCLFISNLMVYTLKIRWQFTVIIFGITNLVCALMIYCCLNNPKYSDNQQTQAQTSTIVSTQIAPNKSSQINMKQTISSQNYNKVGLSNNINMNRFGLQKQFYKFICEVMKSNQIKVYLLINGITSSIFLSLLFWLPIYMVGIKQQSKAGYITLDLQIFAIVGSYFIGCLHQGKQTNKMQNNQDNQIKNEQNQMKNEQIQIGQQINNEKQIINKNKEIKSLRKTIKQYLYNNIAYIALSVNMVVMVTWLMIDKNVLFYLILISISGFCIGGLFNSMHSNDLFIYTKNDPLKTEMFAVIILITNYILTGLTSFIMGWIVQHTSQTINQTNKYKNNINNKINQQVNNQITQMNRNNIQQESQYKSVFIILTVLSIINLVLFIIKSRLNKYVPNQKEISKNNLNMNDNK